MVTADRQRVFIIFGICRILRNRPSDITICHSDELHCGDVVEIPYEAMVINVQVEMPANGDLHMDCTASDFDISSIRVTDGDGNVIRDSQRSADLVLLQDQTQSTEVNFAISGPETEGTLNIKISCDLETTSEPSSSPTTPTIDEECPMATTEVSGINNDFDGCGLGCSTQDSIENCRDACDARNGCVTFSWNPANSACTLYDSDSPTQQTGGQIMCKPDGKPTCNVQCSGTTAYLSGDPHSMTWNGVYHHFQGQTSADDNSPQQFYFMTPCDHNDRHYQPYSILGKFQAWTHNGNLAGLDYITLMLYDEYDTYYVWFSTGIRRYIKAAQGVSTLYDENKENGIVMTQITAGDTYVANGKFKINTNNNEGDQDAWLTLTHVTTGCSQKIYMKYQSSWDFDGLQRWGMHYATFSIPECYKCTTCGMLGDFQVLCNLYDVTMSSVLLAYLSTVCRLVFIVCQLMNY